MKKSEKYLQAIVRTLFGPSAVACCLLAVGCERDFPNPNGPIVENVPMQTLVSGTESAMRIELAIYLRVVSVVGREAYYFEPADPRYHTELLSGNPDPGGFLLNRPWSARYRTVANCRFLLEKAATLSGGAQAGLEGFANTIMAYQLLLNLNYTGANGIQLDFSGNLATSFATQTEALTFIANLLDDAYADLSGAGASFPFTLSTGFEGIPGETFSTPAGFGKFNRALKARVSIYQGNYNGALSALQNSFLNTGAPMDLGVYHVYGTGTGDQGNEIFEEPTATFVKWMAHLRFRTEADSGDARFSSKVAVRTDTTFFAGGTLKSNLGVTVVNGPHARFPIIRNEELVLLRAEANIGLLNYGPAETDMNIVRAAAGLTGYTGTDGTNALDRLLHEKRYSLFLEGHRWVDMRRYNRLDTLYLPLDRPEDRFLIQMPIPDTELP